MHFIQLPSVLHQQSTSLAVSKQYQCVAEWRKLTKQKNASAMTILQNMKNTFSLANGQSILQRHCVDGILMCYDQSNEFQRDRTQRPKIKVVWQAIFPQASRNYIQ